MTEWFRTWIAKVAKDFVTCFITKDRWKYIVKGLGNTLQIALAAVLLGILIGTIVAIIRSTHDKTHETMRPGPGRTLLNIANWLCKVYLTVIRGTPAMIQILIMFFVVFSTARNGTPVAMLTFGINSGAYVAEIVRGGLNGVSKGQFEAGYAQGFNTAEVLLYIVLPQAYRNIVPTLLSQVITTIKDSSYLANVATIELMARIRAALRKRSSARAGAVLSAGPLEMDVDKHSVTVKGQGVELTKKEFDLLHHLLENKGRVLSREALLDSVWGFDFVGETNSVDVYIRFLRSKIDEAFGIKLIHTVRGVGYVIRED